MPARWTVADAASHAECSSATVIRAAQRGELRAERRNGNRKQLYLNPAEVRRWARERRERRK
jgi:hypothetical protein